jgi:hypothetical protein
VYRASIESATTPSSVVAALSRCGRSRSCGIDTLDHRAAADQTARAVTMRFVLNHQDTPGLPRAAYRDATN